MKEDVGWIDQSVDALASQHPLVSQQLRDLIKSALRGVLTEKQISKTEATSTAARLMAVMRTHELPRADLT